MGLGATMAAPRIHSNNLFNSKFKSEEVIFESDVNHEWPITRMKKKLDPVRVKNYVTHAIHLKLYERKADVKWLWRHMVVAKFLSTKYET